jgi:outer membrane protein insertion porin family
MGYFTDESIAFTVLPGKDAAHAKILVELEEKKLISGYEFTGNSQIPAKKLKSGLNIDELIAVDKDDLARMCRQIERLYKKENYLSAKATATLEGDGPESVKVAFVIEEGPKTKVLKVTFIGCKNISEYKLRNMLATKEDWLLAPLDNSGKFDKDLIERDKRLIEQMYKDQGFLQAGVSEVRIKRADNGTDLEITFCIEEGNLYTVNRLGIPYDDEFNALKIERAITLREEQPYSLSEVRESLSRLEATFGEEGYIFANVYPEILPNHDKRTVDVIFKVDKGERCYINEIEITGNKVTKDYVIRRELLLQEGQLANKSLMERSRLQIEYLDYFERGSIDWRVHKVDDGRVNLELVVKEKKSGSASLALNYSPNAGGKTRPAIQFDLNKRNVLGSGIDIGCGLQVSDGAIKNAFVDFQNPYLFDQDLNFACRGYINKVDFGADGLDPIEDTIGAASNIGFAPIVFGRRLRVIGELGLESVDYKIPSIAASRKDIASNGRLSIEQVFARYKEDLFTGGDFVWLGGKFILDRLNYSINPTKGWKVELRNKLALSGLSDSHPLASRVQGHSMLKCELDSSFYWPLIGPDKLVFSARSRLGFAEPLGNSRKTPIIHKELFNVGGVHTVRGFKWGEVGPAFKLGDSRPIPVGGKRMFVANFELAAPVGSSPQAPYIFAFYDFGAGWNSQKLNLTQDQTKFIENDKMGMRHSFGCGIKFSMPYPIRVDYGYKLNRKGGEDPSELHITMNVPF